MVTATSLDVTRIEPRLKHPTIFKHFDELEPGESFIIENDHDPKPLYYELIGERGNIFTWEYIEKGPEWFVVKIAKRKISDSEETVGAIAAKDIRKAEILKAKGVDFCCGGNKTLKEAGEAAGVSEAELKEALALADKTPVSPSQDFDKWNLDFLTDYIINTHHQYIKDNAGNIQSIAHKVAQRHSDSHPELNRLAQGIDHFLQDLLNHVIKEEKVLFPAIKEAVAKSRDVSFVGKIPAGFIKQPIQTMQKEHEIAGEDLSFFRKLTNNYELPQDACNSYNYLFEKMKEFEDDLHRHIHLENNILFPKAIKLEEEQSKK
ncbi:MAG: iron-sulfur cluster repair di-iron protein [Chitinophagaceae bacterium]|nr:iron-sulfur cluster repair di-iron protein [Chitinophagaceae bacterium]